MNIKYNIALAMFAIIFLVFFVNVLDNSSNNIVKNDEWLKITQNSWSIDMTWELSDSNQITSYTWELSSGSELISNDAENIKNTEINEKEIQIDTDDLYFQSAINYLDISECNNIKNTDLKTRCLDNVYTELSIKQNNKNICKKIITKTIKTRCINSFTYKDAINTKNDLICDMISENDDLKYECKKQIVLQKIDSNDYTWWTNICHFLDKNSKEYCENKINSKLSYISDNELFNNAINDSSIEKCLLIKNDDLKKWCNDYLYSKFAVNNNDVSICKSITDINKRDWCIDTINISMDKQHYEQALSNLDKNNCSKIIDKNTRNNCIDLIYIKLAIKQKNISLCKDIMDTSVKTECNKILTNIK